MWIFDLNICVHLRDICGDGAFSFSDPRMLWPINPTDYFGNNPDTLLGPIVRLIVVGINSFQGFDGNGDTPHVVFQFENIPVMRRMDTIDAPSRYGASEMRKHLTPVTDESGSIIPGSGNFLAGLKNAGVPAGETDGVLWAPNRVVYHADGSDQIRDLLWLPTERELTGGRNATMQLQFTTR
jgi:hypothetical protein